MMCEDETGTLAQLKTLRKEVFDRRIAEHAGRIVKHHVVTLPLEYAGLIDVTGGSGIAWARRHEYGRRDDGWSTSNLRQSLPPGDAARLRIARAQLRRSHGET